VTIRAARVGLQIICLHFSSPWGSYTALLPALGPEKMYAKK
jgi:hypothetical protein